MGKVRSFISEEAMARLKEENNTAGMGERAVPGFLLHDSPVVGAIIEAGTTSMTDAVLGAVADNVFTDQLLHEGETQP